MKTSYTMTCSTVCETCSATFICVYGISESHKREYSLEKSVFIINTEFGFYLTVYAIEI